VYINILTFVATQVPLPKHGCKSHGLPVGVTEGRGRDVAIVVTLSSIQCAVKPSATHLRTCTLHDSTIMQPHIHSSIFTRHSPARLSCTLVIRNATPVTSVAHTTETYRFAITRRQTCTTIFTYDTCTLCLCYRTSFFAYRTTEVCWASTFERLTTLKCVRVYVLIFSFFTISFSISHFLNVSIAIL
jgi:hypothetical protein